MTAPNENPAQPAHDAFDVGGCNVLLVDDNEQNLELLLAYLEDLGCELRTATDGAEALAEVAQRRPDLILLDVMMPRMSGFQTCARIKKDPATNDIPIVMVTALNEVSDAERAVESGADGFIVKPVNKLELVTSVRALLASAMAQKRFKATMASLKKSN